MPAVTGARNTVVGRLPITSPRKVTAPPSSDPETAAPILGSTTQWASVAPLNSPINGCSSTSWSSVDIEPVRPSASNNADTASRGASVEQLAESEVRQRL